MDANTHNSDKRPDCKWKKKKETSTIRLQRSLLESNYTIKNVNNRFEVRREIFTLTNICIHNIRLSEEDQVESRIQNGLLPLNSKMYHEK